MPDPIPSLTVQQASEVTQELYQACQRLIPQLTNQNSPPTQAELALLISSESATLFVARQSDLSHEIIGLATLILYRVPTGLRAYLEDLVVDEKARRRGAGEALIRACVERAKRAGATQVMLTSNPNRLAANRLYLRMGFELRKTNVYRYDLRAD